MGAQPEKEAVVFADLGFGDCGKGTTVDWYSRSRRTHTVFRFNGGPQARHNVTTPDGRHHTFSQFGSGTFVDGCRTHLSKHMLISPLAMLAEEKYLCKQGVLDAWQRTTISRDALVITPFQRATNRLREIARGAGRHGSCGVGLGETTYDAKVAPELAIRIGDLQLPRDVLRTKLMMMRGFKGMQRCEEIVKCRDLGAGAEDLQWLEDDSLVDRYLDELRAFLAVATIIDNDEVGEIFRQPGTIIGEPSQGVLLDEARGFDPYTTWSNCTFDNALALLREHNYDGDIQKIGVVRAYQTRHGPGPFVTEDAALTVALPDPHNAMDPWQGAFRVGWFDAVATRYAIEACGGVDGLVVTCFDRLEPIKTWLCISAYIPNAEGVRPGDRNLFRYVPSPLGGIITSLQLSERRGDLTHQRALTEALGRVMPSPLLTHGTWASIFDRKVEEHISEIERVLKTQVKLTSFGQRATDKKIR